MPIPLIPILIATVVILVASVSALVVWNAITEFMLSTLLPWFDTNMPQVAPLLRKVFCAIDKITSPLINQARGMWAQVKNWLLKHTLEIERRADGRWVQRVVTFVRKGLETGDKSVTKVTQEEIIEDFAQLPDEVRAQLIEKGTVVPKDLNPLVDATLKRMELEVTA